MYRPKRNAAQAGRLPVPSRDNPQPTSRAVRSIGVQVNLPPVPTSQNSQQPTLPAAKDDRRNAIPAATTPRVTRQTPFRPVTRRIGLASTPVTTINTPGTTIHTPGTTIAAPDGETNAATAATTAPAAATTALIHEFICLYSNDLRRKHKRWQDGTLRFHTFNQKFMMYDDNGVFVGEGHWQGNKDGFQEGLETKLDRPMACVQVMECTGSKEQDLTQILGKRAREVEERRAAWALAKRRRETEVVEAPSPTVIPQTPPRNTSTAAVTLTRLNNISNNTSTAAVSLTRLNNISNNTSTTPIPLMPLRNRGVWNEHAEDLLGMSRPMRR